MNGLGRHLIATNFQFAKTKSMLEQINESKSCQHVLHAKIPSLTLVPKSQIAGRVFFMKADYTLPFPSTPA